MTRDEVVSMVSTGHGLLMRSIDGLSDAQLTTVPAKMKNNILWNAGHVAQVMTSLVHRPAGRDMIVPKEWAPMFKNGSSPADWAAVPNCAEVVETLKGAVPKALEDLKSGALDAYNAFDLFPGFRIASAENALIFHAFHSGIHLGMILNLKKLV